MKKALIMTCIIMSMASLVGWINVRNGHDEVMVNVETASTGVLSDTVLSSGNFVFNNQIKIRPEVSGRVKQILVEEGEFIREGQLLLRLDTAAYAAEVERASAQAAQNRIEIARQEERLANLERQLQRNVQLLNEGFVQVEKVDGLKSAVAVARIDVDAAQTGLEQAKASLSLARDKLAKTSFTAPMDGLVSSLDIKAGETVIAGTTNIVGSDLMTIADPSAILAELRVDEADIANVNLDQPVEVYAAAYPKQALSGNVVKIGTSAKRLSNGPGLAFEVKVLMNESHVSLFPGMSCRAEIITATGNSTTNVPIAAVQYHDNKGYVWQVENGRSRKVPVTLGMATDTEQAILSGLNVGDDVIVGPARTLSRLKNDTPVNAGSSS
ncbi:efflux RND transporter periplasmic adaptor subunit [Alteromonas halophila]|uniref:RND transporter n=1 Tax=Alteromonas halophila TaxID=516698 RepID=A0A918MZ53_9ALTE|nr:efflux RND transporter periplasmic adaptor subunit [Alteromonas halophila]GGW83933.1 RND transporter [Alteromonas halophila]